MIDELLPQLHEANPLQNRIDAVRDVTFKYTASTGKEIEITWDKECMVPSQDIPVIIEDENLPESEFDLIKKALKDNFERKRAAVLAVNPS